VAHWPLEHVCPAGQGVTGPHSVHGSASKSPHTTYPVPVGSHRRAFSVHSFVHGGAEQTPFEQVSPAAQGVSGPQWAQLSAGPVAQVWTPPPEHCVDPGVHSSRHAAVHCPAEHVCPDAHGRVAPKAQQPSAPCAQAWVAVPPAVHRVEPAVQAFVHAVWHVP
jgi:hypothetical protein